MEERLANRLTWQGTRDKRERLLIVTLCCLAAVLAVYNLAVGITVLVLALVFVAFIRNPEMALAILFNGTLVYFYSVYRLGLHTNRVLTGAFYAFLTCSFLLPEILFLIKRRSRFQGSTIDVLLALFLSLVLLSYLVAATENENAYRKLAYAPLLAIAPYVGTRLLLSAQRTKDFFKYSAFVAVGLMIPAFCELLSNTVLSQQARFSLFFFDEMAIRDNPILFGSTYTIFLMITFVWLFERDRFGPIHLVAVAPAVFLLLRSGARGCLLSFGVAVIFYLAAMSKRSAKTKVLAALILFVLFLGSFQLLPQQLVRFYKYSFSAEAREDPTSSIQMRTTAWKQAIHDFKERPLLGVGFGNSVGGVGSPHNIVLEVSAEYGVVGLCVFACLCYLTIKTSIVFIRDEGLLSLHTLMKLALTVFVYSLTRAMFSGRITNQTHLYMSMGSIACLDNLGRLHLRASPVSSSGQENDKP